MSSSRSTYLLRVHYADGCPASGPPMASPPGSRLSLDSTPGAVPGVRFTRRRRAKRKCKPFGMLDAVSGTRTPTARPAHRGGRGARERILTAATTLFHREGIHATGMERLVEHAHVSKRT